MAAEKEIHLVGSRMLVEKIEADRITSDGLVLLESAKESLKRGYVRKEYYRKFDFATDPITAAKFFQIENRLGLLSELQIASVLPIME